MKGGEKVFVEFREELKRMPGAFPEAGSSHDSHEWMAAA